ncbi:MAG: phosphoribosylanthranilate isomerase [Leeuwenhoekiella sp.]
MKIKVCGMKYNPAEVAALQPDYLGFIFYEDSPRHFEGDIPELPEKIKKVGVFVDEEMDTILEKVELYDFDVIQLHGDESVEFCQELEQELYNEPHQVEVWKVFGIKDNFDFTILDKYEPYVDKFLFDTKGKAKGGNGYTFDWQILKKYESDKPIILSGGIGLEEIDALKAIFDTDLPIYAVDVNSKFEDKAGFKNVRKLEDFIKEIKIQD